MTKRTRINIITMGCSKNLVDSERLIKMLTDAGLEAVHNGPMTGGGVCVINTCGFIGDAKEESIEMILDAARAREDGDIDKLCVMGCLSQRYRDELKAEIPEVDAWYGKFDWSNLVTELAKERPATAVWDRAVTTPPHHAYIKISEGCNRGCAFCAIPIITGRLKSRPMQDILDEVRALTARGVKEFNVIAQDLSAYGHDLPEPKTLGQLIDAMADIEGVEWIRLHYAYPTDFPYDVLPVMARRDNVAKYLDIALQHSADNVLDRMRRRITRREQTELLERIRREVPGIHIRTTLMVGFPGETEEDFEDLMQFVREQRFERMGAFAYCEEEGTFAGTHYTDDVPAEVKQERLDRLMALQEEIAFEHQQAKVGTTLRVVVDSEGDDYFTARSQYDSPEVDPEVLIRKTAPLKRGQMVDVRVTEAMPFELIAELI